MSEESEPNPFQAPQSTDVPAQTDAVRAPNPIAVFIVVVVAMVAAGATFFCTCLGAFMMDTRADEGWLVFCIAASFFAFVLFARIGVIIANRLQRTNMVLSWLSITGAAIAGTITFAVLGMVGGGLPALVCSTLVCTFIIWKLHRIMADGSNGNSEKEHSFMKPAVPSASDSSNPDT